MGACKEDGAKLFSLVPSARSGGSGHKLKCSSFPLSTRKHFCAMHSWSTLTGCPEKLWSIPLGDLQKPCRHGAGYTALGVPAGAVIGPDGPRGPFQPLPFCDSVS